MAPSIFAPALTDLMIMTRMNAPLFICGPDVLEAATGATVTIDQIGSAEAYTRVSGNIHFIAEDEADAIALVQRDWAKNRVAGFSRIQGWVVGIVANQPMLKAGTLEIDSSENGARFIWFCTIFNIPMVCLVDILGFIPVLALERGGIIWHGAKMRFAYAAATVPKITIIRRKSYRRGAPGDRLERYWGRTWGMPGLAPRLR